MLTAEPAPTVRHLPNVAAQMPADLQVLRTTTVSQVEDVRDPSIPPKFCSVMRVCAPLVRQPHATHFSLPINTLASGVHRQTGASSPCCGRGQSTDWNPQIREDPEGIRYGARRPRPHELPSMTRVHFTHRAITGLRGWRGGAARQGCAERQAETQHPLSPVAQTGCAALLPAGDGSRELGVAWARPDDPGGQGAGFVPPVHARRRPGCASRRWGAGGHDGQTTLQNSFIGRTHGLPTSHHSLTVLLGRVVILRSSGARVLRPIDSLASRQNVDFPATEVTYGLGSNEGSGGVCR